VRGSPLTFSTIREIKFRAIRTGTIHFFHGESLLNDSLYDCEIGISDNYQVIFQRYGFWLKSYSSERPLYEYDYVQGLLLFRKLKTCRRNVSPFEILTITNVQLVSFRRNKSLIELQKFSIIPSAEIETNPCWRFVAFYRCPSETVPRGDALCRTLF
jgi:hypothetical protein